MSRFCPRQEEIRQAFLQGPLDEELRSHALSCPDCGQELMVASALRQLDAQELPTSTLPQPQYLWFKARMELRFEERKRRQRLASWTYGAAAVLLLLVLPALVYGVYWEMGPEMVDEGLVEWTGLVAHWVRLSVLSLAGSLFTALLFGAVLRLLNRRLAEPST